jgi:hypothetical protein
VARNLTCRHCQLPMFADTRNRRSTPRREDVAFRYIPVDEYYVRNRPTFWLGLVLGLALGLIALVRW